MALNEGWFAQWFANGWFPAVWFAPADESGVNPDELQAGYGSFALSPTKKLRRKRVFIDGKEYFLNPLEVASLLIERAAKAEMVETLDSEKLSEQPIKHDKVIAAEVFDEVKSRFDIRASQVFINRMNAEIERLRGIFIQRQLEEEDDIECLIMLI